MVNGNSRILNWRYCTIFQAIFCGDIPLHRPYIDMAMPDYREHPKFESQKRPIESLSVASMIPFFVAYSTRNRMINSHHSWFYKQNFLVKSAFLSISIYIYIHTY